MCVTCKKKVLYVPWSFVVRRVFFRAACFLLLGYLTPTLNVDPITSVIKRYYAKTHSYFTNRYKNSVISRRRPVLHTTGTYPNASKCISKVLITAAVSMKY